LAVFWLLWYGGHSSRTKKVICPFSFFTLNFLLYEFCGVPLEFFLACETAEVVCFAVVGDFEFSGVLVEDHAANRISKHCLFFCLMHDSTFCLLWLMVEKAEPLRKLLLLEIAVPLFVGSLVLGLVGIPCSWVAPLPSFKAMKFNMVMRAENGNSDLPS
jgi:hypothetical protein